VRKRGEVFALMAKSFNGSNLIEFFLTVLYNLGILTKWRFGAKSLIFIQKNEQETY